MCLFSLLCLIVRGWIFFKIFITWKGDIKMTYWENHNNPKGNRELMIPPDIVKWKLDGVVDSVPPDKACQVLDGELTHE